MEGLGATAIGLQCDVTGEDNVADAMRATLDRLGRLDCLVANAGTTGKQSFTDMTLDEWHRVLQGPRRPVTRGDSRWAWP